MTNQILTFIRSEFLEPDAAADLTPDSELLISGVIDSLGVMQLVKFLEDSFAVSIPPQDVVIENFQNVAAIFAYVSDRLRNSEVAVQK